MNESSKGTINGGKVISNGIVREIRDQQSKNSVDHKYKRIFARRNDRLIKLTEVEVREDVYLNNFFR